MKAIYPQNKFPDTYSSLENIFNATYNGIVIIGLDGEWLKVNDSLCDLLGHSRDELLQMRVKNIIYRDDTCIHEKNSQKLIKGEISEYQVEQRYFHKDGSLIWFLVSVSLVNDQFGRPHHFIWQFNDITKHKKTLQKLKMMLSVVKEQNERLSSFADIITHNLKSHSGNLATLADFLEEDYEWLKENENYSLLKHAIVNLQETVLHLAKVAKIKEIEPSQIKALNLYKYAEKAIYNISAIAKNANTDIINKIDDNLYIKGFPAYLDSIILNFLTNAIKYRSNERLPKITLSSCTENGYVILKVKDNGLGIDLEKYGNKLFHMYKTFHSNDDALGLGLFITKNQIESLGGKVLVTSKVDQGTEFSIYLKKA